MKSYISLCRVVPVAIMLCLLFSACCAATPRSPQGISWLIRPRLTLLDEVGRLNRKVSAAEVAGWKRRLRRGRLSAAKAARLHLWLGEVAIARDKEPERALEQFQQAQQLARRTDPVSGCAAYDRAMTLFFEGDFDLAAPAFHSLLGPTGRSGGFPITCAALWYRHALACAGYHAQHAKLGITEPPRLDPLCGVASLAACLRANHRPYDRKTLLAHCRMTGLGNNMNDLKVGAQRLGMSARVVKADAEGLKTLPMPVVAYVELDHFVAVTRADKEGVSYLCSDCGAWPGGRRDLTWRQWRAMDCNLFLVVTRPDSSQDSAMRLLDHARHLAAELRGARLAAYHPPAETHRLLMIPLFGKHIILFDPPCNTACGEPATGCECPDGSNCIPDGPGPDPGPSPDPECGGGDGGGGPSGGDPVDLATGEEHYHPNADLTVYNPIGPNVVWRRRYGSLRGPYNAGGLFPYAQFAFGNNWNTDYDYQAVLLNNGGTLTVNFYEPGGGAYAFTVQGTPTSANPQIACPANSPGTPMLCAYNYNADGSLSFIFTKQDRSQWTFSSRVGYALARLTDRNGNFINFVYTTPGSSAGYALKTITDSNNRPLLTLRRNSNFNIVSVTDRYNRSILYQVKRYPNYGVAINLPQFSDELVQVSQITRGGTSLPRYLYGYEENTNGDSVNSATELLPVLHTITVPSPTGRGDATATIHYNGVFVAGLTDANGNTRSYTTIDANDTQVTVTDSKSNTVYSYTAGYDAQMRTTYRTDGTNVTQTYQATYLPDNAFQPATVTDGNNETTSYTYDPFGQVTSVTSPRNVITTYTFDYSVFPLGELKQIQVGSKSPFSFAYYEPSGLVKTITTPAPGTSGSNQTVTEAFTYDSLGNTLTVQHPGNDTTSTITLTVNYTQDGAYSQPDAIGQPLTLTDNLGHVTHMRYDAQGNLIARIDALGNETDYAYSLANQRTSTFAPAIGDITNLLSGTRSKLTYTPATKTYNGTLTLTNTGSQSLQGNLLLAFTNMAPGVSLANGSGTYINSPALLSRQVSLAPGAMTVVNVSFSAPSGNAVSYGVQTYLTDASGNPLALRSEVRSVYLYPGGPRIFGNTYDEAGALYRQVDYGYGKEGELLSASGSPEHVTYSYDAAYRLLALADGNGNTTHYAYNAAGWLQSVTYPLGDNVQYPSYDPMGHPLKRIDGRGIETDYTYNDPESKLTNVAYVNNVNYPNVSQYNITIDYDGYGRAQAVYDVSGHMHYDYDDLDQKTEIDTTYLAANGSSLPTVSLTYAFNPDSSQHEMNLQTATTSYSFTYSYDAVGRPQALTNPYSETTQWSYLNNNEYAAQQSANGVLCEYAYNRRGLLNDITHYAPSGALLSDCGAMVYDAGTNRLTKTETIPGATAAYGGQTGYAYDLRNQLTQETSTLLGGYKESFRFDPAGNPLSFKGSSHGFNANNQFTDSGIVYDGAGNPTSYAGNTLAFDPENHLTAFGTAMTAAYRADGLRAWKANVNGRTYFIYDGIKPVLELDGGGNVSAMNTFSRSDLLSRHTTFGSVFYDMDAHGSVEQRLDASANVISTSAYDAFGAGQSSARGSDPFDYSASWSYYGDAETGLLLLGHRYYDPTNGRFVTRDPSGYLGGVNLYTYVLNRPTEYVDLTGEFPTCPQRCALEGATAGFLCKNTGLFALPCAATAAFLTQFCKDTCPKDPSPSNCPSGGGGPGPGPGPGPGSGPGPDPNNGWHPVDPNNGWNPVP